MLNLLLKDWILAKKNWPFLLFFVVLMAFLVFASPRQLVFFYVIGIFGISYGLFSSAISIDDKNNSEILFNSLPIKRSRIVIARYLSLILYVLISALISLLVVGVSQVVRPNILHPSTFSTWQSLLLGALSFWVLCLIYLPIYFKWGYQKTKIFNIGIFMSAFFVPVIIGNLDRVFPKWMLDNAIDFLKGQSIWMLQTAGLFLVILLGCLSFSISCTFYKKREF